MNRGVFASVAIVAALILLGGCKERGKIALDGRYALSLSPDVKWAVVKEPYVAYRTDKGWDAPTGGYERKGAVLAVLGTSDSGDEVWFRFAGGYLPASAVTIEANRYRAERVAKTLVE